MFQRQRCTGSITTIGWGWLCANNFSSWYLSHTPRRIYSGIIFSSHLWQIIKKNCCCNKQSWICHFLKGKKKTCADKNKTSWQSRSFEIKKFWGNLLVTGGRIWSWIIEDWSPTSFSSDLHHWRWHWQRWRSGSQSSSNGPVASALVSPSIASLIQISSHIYVKRSTLLFPVSLVSECWDRWSSQKSKYQYNDHLVGY